MTLFAFFDIQADQLRRTLSAPHAPAAPTRHVKGNHGTLHAYAVLYCRCLPCRAANAAYKREWRAVQRAKLAQYRAIRIVRQREFRTDLASYRAQQEASYGA